jgi:heme-binding protein
VIAQVAGFANREESFMPWPPIHTTTRLRAGLCGLLSATALGGGAVVLNPSPAVAAPDPCAASQIAKTVGVVATNTGTDLDTHPQTHQALTTISQQQAGPQTLVAIKGYFDANPQAGKDLQAIQQPLTSLSTQCTMPVSLPQLLAEPVRSVARPMPL